MVAEELDEVVVAGEIDVVGDGVVRLEDVASAAGGIELGEDLAADEGGVVGGQDPDVDVAVERPAPAETAL